MLLRCAYTIKMTVLEASSASTKRFESTQWHCYPVGFPGDRVLSHEKQRADRLVYETLVHLTASDTD
jgi:hypothetical protein